MKQSILQEQVDQIIAQSSWGKTGVRLAETKAPIAESTEPQAQEAQPEEAPVQAAHVCPLCESELQQDITDEQLAEHIDLMVDIIDEVASLQEESEDVEASELEDIDEDQIEEATYGGGGSKGPAGSKKPARFGRAPGSAEMSKPPARPGAPGSKTGGKG